MATKATRKMSLVLLLLSVALAWNAYPAFQKESQLQRDRMAAKAGKNFAVPGSVPNAPIAQPALSAPEVVHPVKR